MSNKQFIEQQGQRLYDALRAARTLAPLTDSHPDMTVEDAYHISLHMLRLRESSGERVIGKKIGVTSKPVQDMLGVSQPDFGQLTSGMVFNEGESIDLSKLIAPRAEAEVAFMLKHDLQGPGITAADVLRATECVMPCFEIVDSRIKDWKIKIQDTVADNASCGVFVLGDSAVSPRKVDLSTCGMVLEKNGEIIATGSGAAAMGSPVNAITWLANTLGRLGVPLKAGEVVLSGALAAMFPCAAGDNFRVSIGGIGACSVRFE